MNKSDKTPSFNNKMENHETKLNSLNIQRIRLVMFNLINENIFQKLPKPNAETDEELEDALIIWFVENKEKLFDIEKRIKNDPFMLFDLKRLKSNPLFPLLFNTNVEPGSELKRVVVQWFIKLIKDAPNMNLKNTIFDYIIFVEHLKKYLS